MYAEIVSIGEELLSSESETIDTNSVYITKALGGLGVRVLYKTTVGDDEQRIIDVLRIALSRAQIIITTGGLGPTVDDMTRQGVAGAVGRGLEFQQALFDDIAAKFRRFGVRMSDNNRVQALLPAAAIPIPNPVGTAPGFIVEHEGRLILSLPGVPREMKAMMEQTVVPYLREKLGAPGIIKTRILRTAGIGESLIDEQIGHLERLSNPTVGLNARAGQTDIRITARTQTEAEADALIAQVEHEVREKLSAHIFGVDKEPLEGAFVAALRRIGAKAVIAEMGTGGLLRKRIASQPEGEALIQAVGPEALDALSACFADEPDHKARAERMASALLAENVQNGVGLAVVVLSDEGGTSIAVTNGAETRSRSYAYSASMAGPDFAAGWGLSIAWYLASRMAERN